MAPPLQKTWQGGSTLGGIDFVNQVISEADSATLARSVMFALKESFIGFNLNAWTVAGSSDSSAAGMDAVDRWAAATNLVWSANTYPSGVAHSWIVLAQPAISTNFQVLINLDGATNLWARISVSHVGFTGGSTTAAPTATDEQEIENSVWLDPRSPYKDLLSVIMSDDGECTRVIAAMDTVGHASMRMGFEKPRLPDSDWVNPSVCYHWDVQADGPTGAFRRHEWNVPGLANLYATIPDHDGNPTQVELIMSIPSRNGVEVPDQQEQDVGNIRFFSGGLTHAPTTSATTGHNAHRVWGTLFDWYWATGDTGGSVFAEVLDTFPAAGDRSFVCPSGNGNIVIGWLDDSATDLKFDDI